MDDSLQDSVSEWIEGLREGDSLAAQELWNRYFADLVTHAQKRLVGPAVEASGQDIALSAIKSVLMGVQAGRYPNLVDRNSLWPLLVAVTARKSISQNRRQLARKRGGGQRVSWDDMERVIGVAPTPEFAQEMMDTLEWLYAKCESDDARRIIQRKLEGASHEEVARELGCSVRTVIRKLNLVRQEWEESGLEDHEPT